MAKNTLKQYVGAPCITRYRGESGELITEKLEIQHHPTTIEMGMVFPSHCTLTWGDGDQAILIDDKPFHVLTDGWFAIVDSIFGLVEFKPE